MPILSKASLNIRNFISNISFGVVLSDGKIKLVKPLRTKEGCLEYDDSEFYFKLSFKIIDEGSAIFKLYVKNKEKKRIKDLIVASIPISEDYVYLKNGYQSWSLTRPISVRKRDKKLSLIIPKLTWYARVVHYYRIDEPENISNYFTAIKTKVFELVLGFTSQEHYHGYFIAEKNRIIALNATDDLNREEFTSENLFISISNWIDGFKKYGELLPRRKKKGVYGWCSWYYFYRNIDESKIRRVLKELRELGIPVQVFQVDDGYQKTLGDWLEFNKKFSGSLSDLAKDIERNGFIPGLWIAPFLVTRYSKIYKEHKDWLVKDDRGKPLEAFYNPVWEGKVTYALDLSRDDVIEFLKDLFSKLVEAGFRYLKLDFLYAGMIEGARHRNDMTRVEIYRRALKAIREAVGDDVYLLGCGAPIGESYGFFDGMRIGEDTEHRWKGHPFFRLLRGLTGFWAFPNMKDSLKNTIHRWLLNYTWNNDPDVLILRKGVSDNLIRAQTTVYFLLSGHIMFSDPPSLMTKFGREAYIKSIPPLENRGYVVDYYREEPSIIVANSNKKILIGVVNLGDSKIKRRINLHEFGIKDPFVIDFWEEKVVGKVKEITADVPPRDAKLYVISDSSDEFLGTTVDLGQRISIEKGDGMAIIRAKLPGKRKGKIFLRKLNDEVKLEFSKGKGSVEEKDSLLIIEVEFEDELEIKIL